MTELKHFIRSRWDELLITCVYLNASVASIFTGDIRKVLLVWLGGLVLLAVIFSVRAQMQKRHHPLRGENVAFQVPRRGLIFTVGMQKETILIAARQQKPEFFGFIYTAKSEPLARELMDLLSCNEENCLDKKVNPNNILEVRTETGLILDWMISKGLKSWEIAADITGGTTTMSVGVFSMIDERHMDSQYIYCRQYDGKNCVDGTQEAVFVSRYAQ